MDACETASCIDGGTGMLEDQIAITALWSEREATARMDDPCADLAVDFYRKESIAKRIRKKVLVS